MDEAACLTDFFVVRMLRRLRAIVAMVGAGYACRCRYAYLDGRTVVVLGLLRPAGSADAPGADDDGDVFEPALLLVNQGLAKLLNNVRELTPDVVAGRSLLEPVSRVGPDYDPQPGRGAEPAAATRATPASSSAAKRAGKRKHHRTRPGGTRKNVRLPPGHLTPQAAYRMPILKSLADAGGRVGWCLTALRREGLVRRSGGDTTVARPSPAEGTRLYH